MRELLYKFWRLFAQTALFIINGNARYQGREKLPKDTNYVLVGPHRTWWEMFHFAIGAKPKEFMFMAKEELFENPFIKFILVTGNAFPVKRDNPGPSAIKKPIQDLRKTNLSLVMFPSGTRHSQEMKGGAALIAKLAKVPIVPVVYQGPLTVKDMFKRRRVVVRFGNPIDVSDIRKMNKEGVEEVERRMLEAFNKIDNEIDPNFVYVPIPKKE